MTEDELKNIYDDAVWKEDIQTQILVAEIHRLKRIEDTYHRVMDTMITEAMNKEREITRLESLSHNRYDPIYVAVV